MSDSPVPSVRALLICERVITEAVTNNKTLVGVFDRIQLPIFPRIFGPFWIYARLVDAEGDYTFRVEIIHLETEKQIARADGLNLSVPSRLGASELVFQVQAFNFELPGTYEILIYANDVWIGRTTLSVVQRDQA